VIVAITLTPQRDRPHRLAVLPLANVTGDSDRQYFVDGLHEALIADLSRIETLT
jgi:TolB-like protein